MLNSEVRINGTYYTRVSGAMVKVIVTGQKEITSWTSGRKRIQWCVKRADNGRTLDTRNAAALHMTKDPLREADDRKQAAMAKERQNGLPPLPHKPTPRPDAIERDREIAAGTVYDQTLQAVDFDAEGTS